MAKKSKKPKTPKTPKGRRGNGGGKDSVTGLYMDLEGTLFQTDVTYDFLNSKQALALKNRFGANYQADDGRFDAGGSYKGEYELGRDVIINTNQHAYTKEGIETFQRIAYIGTFKYSKTGALISGTITEVAEWTYARSLTTGKAEYEWGSVDKTQMSIGQNIWDLRGSPNSYTRIYDYDSRAEENNISSDTREGFAAYSSSKFHEANWWNNPFTPNLI